MGLAITNLAVILSVVPSLVTELPILETDPRCTCPPGHFVAQPCRLYNNREAECKPCPYGQFNDRTNTATSCTSCSEYCVYRGQEIAGDCTEVRDIVCVCKEGYYFSTQLDRCTTHSPCPPGQRVKSLGTATEDTACVTCSNGMDYSSKESFSESCIRCTDCTKNSLRNITLTVCNLTHDAVCVEPSSTESVSTTGSTPATTWIPELETNEDDGVYELVLKIALPLFGCALLVLAIISICVICAWKRRGSMANDKATTLQKHRKYIVESLENVGDILDCLLETDPQIITAGLKDEINAKTTRADQVRKLLDILPKRGPTSFDEFIKALKRTNNGHVSDVLCPTIPESEKSCTTPLLPVANKAPENNENGILPCSSDQAVTAVAGTDVFE